MINEIRTKHEQVTVTGEMFILTGKTKRKVKTQNDTKITEWELQKII